MAQLTNVAMKSVLVGAQERVPIDIVMPACTTELVNMDSVCLDAQSRLMQ